MAAPHLQHLAKSSITGCTSRSGPPDMFEDRGDGDLRWIDYRIDTKRANKRHEMIIDQRHRMFGTCTLGQ